MFCKNNIIDMKQKEFEEFVGAVISDSIHEPKENKKLNDFISRLSLIEKNTKEQDGAVFKITDEEISTLDCMFSKYAIIPFIEEIKNKTSK